MQISLSAHVNDVVSDHCSTVFSELKTKRHYSAAAMWLDITFKKCLLVGVRMLVKLKAGL